MKDINCKQHLFKAANVHVGPSNMCYQVSGPFKKTKSQSIIVNLPSKWFLQRNQTNPKGTKLMEFNYQPDQFNISNQSETNEMSHKS